MWNEQKSEQLVKTFKTTNFDAEQTAKELGISKQSAISKLVALGEYRKQVVESKTSPQKQQYIQATEAMLGVKSGTLAGLGAVNFKTLEALTAALVKVGDKPA